MLVLFDRNNFNTAQMNTDSPKTDNASKFEQLSPVLELMYLMITTMQKYLRVYAEDRKLDSGKEYKETYEALMNLKRTLDRVYGIADEPLRNPSSARKSGFNAPQQRVPQQNMPQKPMAPAEEKAPSFDSMRQSLNELRSAVDLSSAPQAPAVQAVQREVSPLVSSDAPPFFEQPVMQSAPRQPEPQVTPQYENPAMNPIMQGPQQVAPAAMQQPVQAQAPQPAVMQPGGADSNQSSEIDSILSELRKLQSPN